MLGQPVTLWISVRRESSAACPRLAPWSPDDFLLPLLNQMRCDILTIVKYLSVNAQKYRLFAAIRPKIDYGDARIWRN
jgi:hypothetical protein